MSIRILDIEVCLSCKKETCAYIDRVTKSGTAFVSEETVCPTAILQANPSMMTTDPFADKKCISCGLCVGYCNKQNLRIECDGKKMNIAPCSSVGLNVLVSNYLHGIFPFAANSNRNSSVLFDGYVQIDNDKEAFVEVDEKDALECCRNLLGDFLLYEGQFSNEVDMGLVVLGEIPSRGTSNVYTVIERMHVFPKLESKQIYLTTFTLLRHLFLHHAKQTVKFEYVFFNPLLESLDDYKKRIATEIEYDM